MSQREPLSRQTTLFVRDHCLCLFTQRAARALARRFDDALRPLNLTSGQFSVLMSLNRPTPPAIGELAEFLAMDRTTLTAACKPLQRRGLIAIMPNPRDRRSRLLVLEPGGRELLARAVPIWKSVHGQVEGLVGDPHDLRTSLELLARSGDHGHHPI